jgi:nitrogen-specific signal transduction histidine kinase/CheY-like chemotaxis protein
VLVLREVTAERALQEQLQRQERLAAVGQLAAGIAHDFNNIMSVISIYAELTSDAPGLSDYERGRTHTIMSQAQRATRLIRQILDFSRQSVFERHNLDLLPLLKEEEKLLKQTLPESIELRLLYAKDEYLVLADATRMQQLVMNLAVNARDAMPDGGTLELELAHMTADGGHAAPLPGMSDGKWVRLRVRDSGCGIAPEHMAHVFEPFFTTKAPGEGTGLGLAQAHGIVAQHDGHITVESEAGAGTVFTIYLPALALTAPDQATSLRQQLPQGHGECVLLVEDDAHLRASLVDLLTNWHYQVLPAADGEEALCLLAQRPAGVDVILSDVVMPRMGGIALVNALRKEGIDAPVLLMTGHTAQSRREELAGAGVDAWLDKPPSIVELAQALKSAAARR